MTKFETVSLAINILNLASIQSVFTEYQLRKIEYHKESWIDGRISTSVTEIYDKMSRIQCGSKCTEDESCYSYFHNVLNGACALLDDVPVTFLSTRSESGWCYFNEKKLIAAPIDPTLFMGDDGGDDFTDVNIWEGRPITAIVLWCSSSRVEGIQARYGTEWGPLHGDPEDDQRIYSLNPDEYINKIYGEYDNSFDKIIITTNQRVLPACGGNGGAYQKTLSGTRLAYLAGRAHSLSLQRILVVWTL